MSAIVCGPKRQIMRQNKCVRQVLYKLDIFWSTVEIEGTVSWVYSIFYVTPDSFHYPCECPQFPQKCPLICRGYPERCHNHFLYIILFWVVFWQTQSQSQRTLGVFIPSFSNHQPTHHISCATTTGQVVIQARQGSRRVQRGPEGPRKVIEGQDPWLINHDP